MFTGAHLTRGFGKQRGFDVLRQNIAPGALHNSIQRYNAARCHPQTHRADLTQILKYWVQDHKNGRRFLWVFGEAGAGKSSIAQTVAEMCHEAGILAASFFFSQFRPEINKYHLIATIIYQITLVAPMIRDWVVKTRVVKMIENDPGIFYLPLSAQIQALIVKPLNDAADQEEYWESPDRPKIVVIDGLDECGDVKSRLEVLHALLELRQLKIPLPLIITS
ncbi:hypothetical protein BDZ97DRAFT_53342 [Flammula alnicola]|nr:hypothetical protein BDZ97DRAFT_53342 [Flammula alnicola]